MAKYVSLLMSRASATITWTRHSSRKKGLMEAGGYNYNYASQRRYYKNLIDFPWLLQVDSNPFPIYFLTASQNINTIFKSRRNTKTWKQGRLTESTRNSSEEVSCVANKAKRSKQSGIGCSVRQREERGCKQKEKKRKKAHLKKRKQTWQETIGSVVVNGLQIFWMRCLFGRAQTWCSASTLSPGEWGWMAFSVLRVNRQCSYLGVQMLFPPVTQTFS